MRSMWLSALADVDGGLAAYLKRYGGGIAAELPGTSPDSASLADVAHQWLERQIPCPNVLVTGGHSQINLILPLLRLNATIKIIWLDRDAERLVAGLNALDSEELVNAIRSGRLVVDAGEQEDPSIDRFLGCVDFSREPRIRLLDAEPIPPEDHQMVIDMTKAARELIRFQSCDLATRLKFGKTWQANTIGNIPAIVRHAGIKTLFGAFTEKPAIVIAAGPSLEDAIPFIATNRHRLVVLAVGRVLRHLVNRYGIIPDLIVTGDGQDMVVKHFESKPAFVPVVATCFTDPELIAGLDRLFFMDVESIRLPQWLENKVGTQGEIFPGGNVATAAMAVAEAMGCNPVMTAGVDLSYPESGKTHVAGRTLDELADDPEYENRQIYEVEGNYRSVVKTNRQMLHYIDFTSDFVKGHPQTCFVNLNNDGARIEGMKLDQHDAITAYLGGPVNAASRIARLYLGAVGSGKAIRNCINSLSDDIPHLTMLRRECMEAAMRCNQIIMLIRRPGPAAEAALQRHLASLKPLDEKLKNDPVMQLLEARLEDASRKLSERMLSSQELRVPPAIRSNMRWRHFYKSVADACLASEKMLDQVVKQLATMIRTTDSGHTESICKECA